MKNKTQTLPLFFFLLFFNHVYSWKKEEFRTCHQTPFCKRARSRTSSTSTPLVATDVTISDGNLIAKLVAKSKQEETQQNTNPLLLSLSVYQNGVVRVTIDEDHSLNPPKSRFHVPDVVVSEFQSTKLWLQRVTQETLDGDDSPSSVVYVSDGFDAVLRHDPFEVFVRDKSNGNTRVVSMNSHGLFDFEQLKVKGEGDDWGESFRSHHDKRPYGPQSISFDVTFHGADFVYGIPEHATSLALKPTKGPGVEESEPYRLFNLDVFEYIHDSPFGLYGSVPFMLSHGKQRGSSGFFWLNAAEMQIDVLGSGWDAENGISKLPKNRVDTLWMSEAGVVDAFFFVGPTPKDVLKQYTSVTGMPAMPQLFSTAYHQCRWNYRDEEDVEHVDSKFDEFDIPYDVLWLDIEHTDGKKYFTWDNVLFPNPEEMQRKIAAKGRHMVTIVDPHIKRDNSFPLHKEATEKGYYVKDSSGNDYDGWCWPGSSSYLDMLSPEIRSWWGDKFSYQNYVGSTPSLYIWNDMNEPSVFNGPEVCCHLKSRAWIYGFHVTMPRDALHIGGVEHREVHNAYGYYFHMATSEGLVKRGDGKDRPFVLSRALFAGTQRYGAIWTGDNTAEWDHLRVSVPMVLTLGLAGVSFSGWYHPSHEVLAQYVIQMIISHVCYIGADVGGFFGNPEPELLVRWYQLGAFYPFFRAHAHHDTKRREPWLFGERNTELIRDAIHVRYALLPYYYTLFREANTTGVPVMRPLWMEFPSEEATFSNDEAFMIGNSLLVQGIYTERAKQTSVYLPGKESWYDFRTGNVYKGEATHKLAVTEESIPVFMRAGTIITRKDRFRRSSTQMTNDPYTLVIALNSSQAAEGELYLDDGSSFNFLQGAYIHRRFIFKDGKLTSLDLAPASNGNARYPVNTVIESLN
uniref:Glucosidase II subunit alpha n=1 Tax=Arachis duranensis TaxID=130453 RepID=N1NFV5_ARADU|nr:glycoside hydrolase [Arachis duranensis]